MYSENSLSFSFYDTRIPSCVYSRIHNLDANIHIGGAYITLTSFLSNYIPYPHSIYLHTLFLSIYILHTYSCTDIIYTLLWHHIYVWLSRGDQHTVWRALSECGCKSAKGWRQAVLPFLPRSCSHGHIGVCGAVQYRPRSSCESDLWCFDCVCVRKKDSDRRCFDGANLRVCGGGDDLIVKYCVDTLFRFGSETPKMAGD